MEGEDNKRENDIRERRQDVQDEIMTRSNGVKRDVCGKIKIKKIAWLIESGKI